jgi:hypothetical protein
MTRATASYSPGIPLPCPAAWPQSEGAGTVCTDCASAAGLLQFTTLLQRAPTPSTLCTAAASTSMGASRLPAASTKAVWGRWSATVAPAGVSPTAAVAVAAAMDCWAPAAAPSTAMSAVLAASAVAAPICAAAAGSLLVVASTSTRCAASSSTDEAGALPASDASAARLAGEAERRGATSESAPAAAVAWRVL